MEEFLEDFWCIANDFGLDNLALDINEYNSAVIIRVFAKINSNYFIETIIRSINEMNYLNEKMLAITCAANRRAIIDEFLRGN